MVVNEKITTSRHNGEGIYTTFWVHGNQRDVVMLDVSPSDGAYAFNNLTHTEALDLAAALIAVVRENARLA